MVGTYAGDVREILGSWLDGPRAALTHARERGVNERPEWRGQRLGLPQSGAGAAAGTGRRALAFLLDIVFAALIAAIFTAPDLPRDWSLLSWAVITVVPVSFVGATPGMMMLRIWVARVDGSRTVGPLRAVLRCALTAVIVPAVIWNYDNRSWHDRLSGTVVLQR